MTTEEDHAPAYAAVRSRIDDLVQNSDVDLAVPACPGWLVRDVVAHLAGLCEDWVERRLDGYASQRWTAAQVARFEGDPIDNILERWSVASVEFERLPDDPLMGTPARWALGDALVHEADIRGALRADRAPHDAVLLGLKGYIARWRETLAAANTPPLLVRAPGVRDWWIGHPTGANPHVEVEVEPHELFRALSGRRSVDQVRRWRWTGDAEPYVAAGLPFPFHFRSEELAD